MEETKLCNCQNKRLDDVDIEIIDSIPHHSKCGLRLKCFYCDLPAVSVSNAGELGRPECPDHEGLKFRLDTARSNHH